MMAENGDVWKGSYNISKSENLVDNIKSKSGMDVTFFYGKTRIMTSAMDDDGNRILASEAGDKIIKTVLEGGEEYFSKAVSLDGNLNYGYYHLDDYYFRYSGHGTLCVGIRTGFHLHQQIPAGRNRYRADGCKRRAGS